MKKADLISGFFWFFVAVYVTVESYRLGLGNLRQPGPGYLFFWAGILLGIMSIVIISRAWLKPRKDEAERPIFGKISIKKIVLVLAAVFLYAFLLEHIGFIVVTALFFIFLLGFVEKKGWLFTIVSSVIVTAASYLIFQTWLQTQLPQGILGFLHLQ